MRREITPLARGDRVRIVGRDCFGTVVTHADNYSIRSLIRVRLDNGKRKKTYFSRSRLRLLGPLEALAAEAK